MRVELQRTLLTDVPGIAFGVRAEAFSNEDDTPVKGEEGLHCCLPEADGGTAFSSNVGVGVSTADANTHFAAELQQQCHPGKQALCS